MMVNNPMMLAFVGECPTPHTSYSRKEVEESIAECQAMLSHSIAVGEKDEVAFWRRMLQHAKLMKRGMIIV